MPKTLVALALVAMLAAGCGGGGRPQFQAASGWHVLTEPRQFISATNVSFTPSDKLQSEPLRTIASLPRYGIVIWVGWQRPRHRARTRYRRRALPLRVENTAYTGQPEGVICPSAAPGCFISHLSAKESGWDVDVSIFFGTAHPLPEEIAAADAELARLRFPGTPNSPVTVKAAHCRRPSGTGYYTSTVRPTSGPVGTTVMVSGRLPVMSESGQDVGQNATEVVGYWNLDLDHWPSITSSSPIAAVGGSPVTFVGTRNVAGRCAYHVQVTVPSASPGRYPIDVLYGNAKGGASFAPASFRVTSR